MSEDLSKLNLVELVDRLEMVAEPEAISLFPQTAGWIWLGLAVVALIVLAVHRFQRWRRANAYRRAGLDELARAKGDPARIAVVLRRAALSGFPRKEVAGLHGNAWLEFLDQSYGGTGFRDGPGRVLAAAPYRATDAAAGLDELAADWLRRHRSGVP